MTTINKQAKDLLATAAQHYATTLQSSPEAVKYLRQRGFTGAIAGRFGLGYSSKEWRGLSAILRAQDAEVIAASGLTVADEKDPAKHYDRFRSRVMFPIRDLSGAVVGFGGRVIDDTLPKYLNSPENEIFQKREILYGLYEAQKDIEAENIAFVVEGYLDVIALAQADINTAVAALGTACTASHIQTLLTHTKRIVFCFDGDKAGRRAAARAMETVLPFASDDVAFSFMFLPEKHDPDSYVKEHGKAGFLDMAKKALSLDAFIFDSLLDGCPIQFAEGKAQFVSRAKPIYKILPEGKERAALMMYCVSISECTQEEILKLWHPL